MLLGLPGPSQTRTWVSTYWVNPARSQNFLSSQGYLEMFSSLNFERLVACRYH